MSLNHIVKVVAFTATIGVLLCLPSQLSGHARSTEGKVKGVTTDERGAVIPSATVVFESAGLRREVKSNEVTGEFELTLPAGEYRVSSVLEAFYPYKRQMLRVEAGKTKKLRVKFKSKYPPITE
jgi:hypothetical protein